MPIKLDKKIWGISQWPVFWLVASSFLVTGCSGLGSFNWNSVKIEYKKDLRGYVAKDGEHEKVELLLRDETGSKIRSQEEAQLAVKVEKRRHEQPWEASFINTLLLITAPINIAIGAISGAVTSITPAISYAPHLAPEKHYKQGLEAYHNGNYESAAIEFKIPLERFPDLRKNSDIYYWLGKSYQQLHMNDAALAAFTTFLDYAEKPGYYGRKTSDAPELNTLFDDAEKNLHDLRDQPSQ